MKEWVDIVLIAIVVANLMLLVSSRLAACIRIVAVQGIAAGILPLVMHPSEIGLEMLAFSGCSIILKGVVFPWLLSRVLREGNVRREVEAFVSFSSSVIVGVICTGLAFWITRRLPLPVTVLSPLIIPVSFATIFIGLFVITSRVQAMTQVLGYLVLENGIYVTGMAFLVQQPVVVELGILLDIFVAVFVMGIAIFHISREFDHIDTQQLSKLRDN